MEGAPLRRRRNHLNGKYDLLYSDNISCVIIAKSLTKEESKIKDFSPPPIYCHGKANSSAVKHMKEDGL